MKNVDKSKEKSNAWSALSLAWQLGYTIAIPLVIFALIGRFLDKYFNTSPWLLLAGIILSIVISTVGIYHKAMKIISTTEAEQKEEKE